MHSEELLVVADWFADQSILSAKRFERKCRQVHSGEIVFVPRTLTRIVPPEFEEAKISLRIARLNYEVDRKFNWNPTFAKDVYIAIRMGYHNANEQSTY